MSWSNVKLIFEREVRDQLRDRRTLFMIAVLPLLLYPLLGISIFQVRQFMREQVLKVLVIEEPKLSDLPALVKDGRFAEELFPLDPGRAELLAVESYSSANEGSAPADTKSAAGSAPATADASSAGKRNAELARAAIQRGDFDTVIVFAPNFAEQLEGFRDRLLGRAGGAPRSEPPLRIPSPELYYNTAQEKSRLAHRSVDSVLRTWQESIGRQLLRDSRVPEAAAHPFDVAGTDVAPEEHRDAATWSKILPFVLLIWALTGAFYPAVDLCAGEKERGTLETLLSSPAERSEIVCGKLLTIMLFSMATSVLNLLSMGLTGAFVVKQLESVHPDLPLGVPPLSAALWLVLALVPISALFSALCLALAALARSTKEGQYYLMPLVLVAMPLVILPMAPGVELNLGNSLIPVTGVVLLLRALLEGNYLQAAQYVLPVAGVTLGCCLLAIRWAVDQFNTESVLFRGAERLDMGLWIRHLVRDRDDTPTVAEGLMCGVLILALRFFFTLSQQAVGTFSEFAMVQTMYLFAGVAMPAILMALMFTRRPARTLLLRRPPWLAIPAAVCLAVVIHPVVKTLSWLVFELYPPDPRLIEQMQQVDTVLVGVPFWQIVIVLALVPAICEELAFRGFILSGLRRLGHKWRAIIISSLFFGVAHLIVQQSLITMLIGVVIGYVAVQSGSLWPCMVFHLTHNVLGLWSLQIKDWPKKSHWLVKFSEDGDFSYHWWVLLVATFGTFVILQWFRKLPYHKSPEERLQESIDQHAAHLTA